PARLVGSAACAECHADVADRWRGSNHARAMQKATAETVLGQNAGRSIRNGRVTWKLESGAGGVRARSEGVERGEDEVAYTLGVDPIQELAAARPDGRSQRLPVAWNARPAEAGGQRWFAVEGDGHAAAGDPAHWKSPDKSANATCADCHTTGFEKRFDLA